MPEADAAGNSSASAAEAIGATLCWSGVSKLVGGKMKGAAGSAGAAEQNGKRLVDLDGMGHARRHLALPGGQLHRILELLPGEQVHSEEPLVQSLGVSALRSFWATFAALDLPAPSKERRWTRLELTALRQTRNRCLAAAAPFQVVLRLLEDSWTLAGRAEEVELLDAATAALAAEERRSSGAERKGPEILRKAREAAAAAKASGQWNVLLAVQHLIGRSSGEAAPAWKEMELALPRLREKYLTQARMFVLIAAALDADMWEGPQRGSLSDSQLASLGVAELRRLTAAQGFVPAEWRALKPS
eukprot:TRINITY_DN62557_c0_g1_i1.p1 TRINITY_DN62557_c0_g1~~TRINITY_DN62557_c0_g1_i1.p1  ORF type:complete len:302 (-),score=64.38 TRINITY_DN62557_c0_g1_i1:54-959(-)